MTRIEQRALLRARLRRLRVYIEQRDYRAAGNMRRDIRALWYEYRKA